MTAQRGQASDAVPMTTAGVEGLLSNKRFMMSIITHVDKTTTLLGYRSRDNGRLGCGGLVGAWGGGRVECRLDGY